VENKTRIEQPLENYQTDFDHEDLQTELLHLKEYLIILIWSRNTVSFKINTIY
jgi:hypothetical protein